MKKYLFSLLFIFSLFMLIGCQKKENKEPITLDPDEHICDDNLSGWIDDEIFTCGEQGNQHIECTICHNIIEERDFLKRHNYQENIIKESTCTENGEKQRSCTNCGNIQSIILYKTGHTYGELEVIKEPTDLLIGQRNLKCSKCNEVIKSLDYVNNGYNHNGKLSVNGTDLVNQEGVKYQLYGLSTHGMQWFGRYANFDTIASLQESFGINVIRFAFYTDENGYCDGTEATKEKMLEDLHRGIAAATKLGLYVIVDWHMVGAENVDDKNPLTYLKQSKEFFTYISEYYKNQDNILYEIMNEPNGSTTWNDCKKYANEVIPCIRKNTNSIILIGNPHWTADLNSVMADPLVGYENIMYTYHFYAGDHKNTSQVINAYNNGIPVFISEYGLMNSDGDGPINTLSGKNWYKILDERNISYVAWNISNSSGSASIFKHNSNDMTNVDDENLKEWGIYLKELYRLKSGLDK